MTDMTPSDQTAVAEWLRDHPDATEAHAITALAAARTLGPAALKELVPAPARPTNEIDDKRFLAGPAVEGLETFDHGDVRLPILKLRQPQTPGAQLVPEGAWFVSTDHELHSPLREIVVLSLGKERSMLLPFGGGDAADELIARISKKTGVDVPIDWQGPVCFSRDRVTPVEQEGIERLAKDCASCPMNGWRTLHGRRLQDCGESYRVLVYDRTASRPAFYFARGSAIKPFRDLLNQLQLECRRHDRPSFAYSALWSTRQVDSEDGLHYYVPVFSRPYPIEDLGEVAFLASVARCYRGVVAEEE